MRLNRVNHEYNICKLVGGTIIEGKLIWTDGSPTDYTLWSHHHHEKSQSGACIAVFADLLFKQTRNKTLELNTLFELLDISH